MKISYNWLKEYIRDLPEPHELAEKLTMAGLEVEGIGEVWVEAGLKDYILDINVTPNRPDCLSIIGVTREVSALTGKSFKEKGFRVKEAGRDIKGFITVKVLDPDLCPRYTARVVEGVTIGPSPDWLKTRLEVLGIRPINNVVDITNYVMLEHGQPLHAFDYNLIADKRIEVRRAKRGEEITTLDGVRRPLEEGDLVICDGKGPVALAGVMGGKESEVKGDTRDILLESAFFLPKGIRRTSKAMGITTESSYRFERGVDRDGVVKALDRAAMLVSQVAGGNIAKGYIDVYPDPYKPPSIELRVERVNAILGRGLKGNEIKDQLRGLGIILKPSKKRGVFIAVPPSFRVDISREIDLIEEIARLTGYDRIATTLPRACLTPSRRTKAQVLEAMMRDILTNNGFLEVVNYSFISPSLQRITGEGAIRLLNPLTEEQSIMRGSLIPSLLNTLRYNINRKNTDIRVFEIRKVFAMKDGSHEEERRASGLISGLRGGGWNIIKEKVDFYDVKGVVEVLLEGIGCEGMTFIPREDIPYLHPGRGCNVVVKGKDIGILGGIHPAILDGLDIGQPVYIFELDVDTLMDLTFGYKTFKPLPIYPGVVRDVAIVIDKGIPSQMILEAIKALDTKVIEDVSVFDVYCGRGIPEGKRGMAFRIVYRSEKKTLTDEEVNTIHQQVVRGLMDRFGAELRGGL